VEKNVSSILNIGPYSGSNSFCRNQIC